MFLGISVDQSKGMLGTFAPQKEPYVHTLKEDITPSGVLARGVYSAKIKVWKVKLHMSVLPNFCSEFAVLNLLVEVFFK